MQTNSTDRLGRATFGHIVPIPGVIPTERELRWLKHIERHGPQSSEWLIALTSDTHRCKDTALRCLQWLRAGGYLRLPQQQRQTARADFNPYIYDLTKRSANHLVEHCMAERTIRPTGHWWHGYAVSALTGWIDILARQEGIEYIPAHMILQRVNVDLRIPVGRQRLIPDQLFALRYPTGYRAFLLEVDRGTEPLRSKAARKSLMQSVELYREMFATEAHRRHYGLKATTVVLFAFCSTVRLNAFLELVQAQAGDHAQRFLGQVMPREWRWQEMASLNRGGWISGAGGLVALV